MTLEEFCVRLIELNLPPKDQAVAVLWLIDNQSPGNSATPGEITRALRDAGVGEYHSTRLGSWVQDSGHALLSGKRLKLKPVSRRIVQQWVAAILEPEKPKAEQDKGYLPKAVWESARPYVQTIAKEVNGCYHFELPNAASVLLRRLLETLLIEGFEHKNIADQIKCDGNYLMLGDIIKVAVKSTELSLSRGTKDLLNDGKFFGDMSAHARRFAAVQADLDKIHNGVRAAVDELLHLCGMK
ncbi:MAG TPA: hypothetical protein VHU84_07660 [Lacipirellulaceae bacterium]|nr:hypothetical protein [Lacipirellulaceae bacterium]